MEYRIVTCLGKQNVVKAIEDKLEERIGWKIHTIMFTGIIEHRASAIAQGTELIPTFMILFERLDQIGPMPFSSA